MNFFLLISSALAFPLVGAYLVSPPGPAAPGTTADCSAWAQQSYALTCADIERVLGITQAEFEAWNPSTTELGPGCNLIADLYYCISINFIPVTTVTTFTTPTTFPSVPSASLLAPSAASTSTAVTITTSSVITSLSSTGSLSSTTQSQASQTSSKGTSTSTSSSSSRPTTSSSTAISSTTCLISMAFCLIATMALTNRIF